jgi:EAL domain-containing protein (putative c-di-GMP-specific phosphodiesterase class I)
VINNCGAGFSGLNLLAIFQPDSIKIDMSLLRDIDSIGPKQAIVRRIIRTCRDLGIDILAEGIESIVGVDKKGLKFIKAIS